jgi:hypothetical protein
LRRSWTEDVIVLDLESAGATAEAVVDLRTSGHRQPVIVVANDTDGWDGLFADHPELHLISLPIAPKSLLSTVDRAMRGAGGRADSESVPRLASVGASDTGMAPTAPDAMSAEPLPAPGTSATTSRAPLPQSIAEAASPVASHQPTPTLRADAIDLVRDLMPLVARLSRLPEVAEMARVRCTSVVPCDASAVLVPDGDGWRVAAGYRLRPLEERIQIESTHWLISEVVSQGHGVLIRDTDIARTKLSGAPLASWPNLLALPITEVDAVVLLARRTKAFTRSELTSARQALGSASSQLREAVDTRNLARAMGVFSDPVV